MGYYRNILQDKAETFEFNDDENMLSENTINQFKKIEELFYQSIEILKNPDSEMIFENIQDIYIFYEYCDRFVTYLLRDLFRKRSLGSLVKDRQLFLLFEQLFRIFYLFDLRKHENIKLFCDFTVYKEKKSNKYFRFTTFSAMSMPMAHLVLSYFVTEQKEIYYPQILKKRGTIHLFTRKKHLLYYISCITCQNNEYPFCRLYFCALFNTFFQSYYLYSHILKFKREDLLKYYKEMQKIE